MVQIRSVTEVARHFAEYINRVSYRGELRPLCGQTCSCVANKPVAEALAPPASCG